MAGFPSVRGRDLVEGQGAQAATADPAYFLDRTALTLAHVPAPDGGSERVVVGLDDGTEITAGAVLVTAGIGKFSPRPLPAGEGWLDGAWSSSCPASRRTAARTWWWSAAATSAFDWAQHLEPIARPP